MINGMNLLINWLPWTTWKIVFLLTQESHVNSVTENGFENNKDQSSLKIAILSFDPCTLQGSFSLCNLSNNFK